MKITAKRAAVVYVFIFAFLAGLVVLAASFFVNGSAWASDRSNAHLYSGGSMVNAGTVFDREGKILARSADGKRIFSDDAVLRKATLHVVGDPAGYISTGCHSLYRDALSGYSFAEGVYRLKKDGAGGDIILNIDSSANKIAYKALGNYDGALAAYNYKTGELLCSVSKPSYDVKNKPADLLTNKKYDGVFLDKVVSGLYTPGSVMKLVTAVCAIENIPDIFSREFRCDGKCETGDGAVVCNGVHGKINFQQAMNDSCNSAFAEIALELGAEKLLASAESLGFNARLRAKEVRLAKSRFSPSETSEAELGWAGIGQSTTLVNPAHMLVIAGAVANGGKGLAPDRIRSVGRAGKFFGRVPSAIIEMDPGTAAKLDKLLRSNVKDKYGDWKFEDLEMRGKTGTAQVADGKSHSWFVGYSGRPDLPIAVVCVAEHGGYGSGVALKASNAVLQYFLSKIGK